MYKIPYIDLGLEYKNYKSEINKAFSNVMKSGDYIDGLLVKKFEKEIANFLGVKHVLTLNSGTDALLFSLAALGLKKNDEVITVSNSYIATVSAICHFGAKPVFVDVKSNQNIDVDLIEKKITKKTKMILPVHLGGRPCDMNKIRLIAKRHKLFVVEDAAQAFGSKINKKKCGTFSDIGCFSFHPFKNLNSYDDGGVIVTNNTNYFKKVKIASRSGISNGRAISWGLNSRLNSVASAILRIKLKNLNNKISKRIKNVNTYKKFLNNKFVYIPEEEKNCFNSFHTFTVQVKNRDKLKKYLEKKKIETKIHYPVPIHLQPVGKFLSYKRGSLPILEEQSKNIISLPIHEFLTKEKIIYICKIINNFYR